MQLFRPGPPCRAGSFTVHFNSLFIAPDLIGFPCRAKRDRQAAPVWHFMPFSRALRARGSLCKGIKKNFRRRPAKTPLPLISDCPGGVVLPLPRQHSALLLFLMPGIAQTRLMCFSALAFQCRVVNVVFHLARTADKTTVFLAEPQRQGRKPHTITL